MIVNLKTRLDEAPIRELLTYSVGYPTIEKIDRIVKQYTSDPAWYIIGFQRDNAVEGCVGYLVLHSRHGVIRHIAVQPGARRKGIGRLLITWLQITGGLTTLTAETDEEAVGFYRHCGFLTTSLGETYPGVERFRCELVAELTL